MRRAFAVASAVAILAASGTAAIASARPAPKKASPAEATTSTTTPGQSAPVLRDGGTVTVAVQSLPTEFNPWTPAGGNAITSMVMQQVWPEPFVVNNNMEAVLANDTSGLPGSGLLTAELVGVNPQTVVYSINPKAKWSDGVPITATDFIYDWKRQLAYGPELSALDPLAGYQDIASITGANRGKTMTVTFKQPYADWEALFTDLVPAHIAVKYGWAKAFASFDPTKLISGGPFAITQFVPGKELVLTRNQRYWGHRPLLDRIIFRVESGERATLRALQSGRVDVAQLTPTAQVANAVATSTHLMMSSALTPVLWQLGMNLADPVLSQPAVREAIAKAIDRNQLVTNTIGLLTAYGQTSGNRVYAAGAPGSQGNDAAYAAVEVTEADTVLASIGYSISSGGQVLTPTGKPLVLHLLAPAGNGLVQSIESEIAAQLLQAGITLEVTNVSKAELLDTLLPSGRFQLALVPFIVSAFPSTTAQLYTNPVGPEPVAATTPETTTTGLVPVVPQQTPTRVAGDETEPDAAALGAVTRDVLGYDDPQVASLYAAASTQLNAIAASGIYNEIDQDLWLDLPTLPLFQMPEDIVVRTDVVNVSDTQTLVGPLWDAQDWAILLNPPVTSTTLAGG